MSPGTLGIVLEEGVLKFGVDVYSNSISVSVGGKGAGVFEGNPIGVKPSPGQFILPYYTPSSQNRIQPSCWFRRRRLRGGDHQHQI